MHWERDYRYAIPTVSGLIQRINEPEAHTVEIAIPLDVRYVTAGIREARAYSSSF